MSPRSPDEISLGTPKHFQQVTEQSIVEVRESDESEKASCAESDTEVHINISGLDSIDPSLAGGSTKNLMAVEGFIEKLRDQQPSTTTVF